MDTLLVRRAVARVAGVLAVTAVTASAQSLVDVARETEARHRAMPTPSTTIALGSEAFQDVALTDELFTRYAETQEALARLLLGDQVRSERFTQRRRAYRPGTDATALYEAEPELRAAIAAMGFTPQAIEDIAWSISRAYAEKLSAPPSLARLANRAWIVSNNARVLEHNKRLGFIRAGLRP